MRTAPAAQHGGDAGGLPGSLRRLFAAGALGGLTDGQLLDRFLRGGREADADAGADAEAAFAALVERHGAMVWQVCRSVLGDRHDAEDACQAAFLVLARRAGSIRRGESVASWLYGVARRVALRARRDASRRRELERRRLERTAAEEPISPPPADPWPELYEELDRLPEPFRAAVVSCDLEGLTYEQAAVLLGCPVGTVQSRLARGRSRLRNRLERRGIAPAVVGVVIGATGPAVRAASSLPSALSESITRAACGVGAGRTIAAAVPAAAASLAGAEVRRQLMRRVVTLAMTFLVTGVTAATALVLASAGRDGGPRPRQQQQPIAVAKAAPATFHIRVVEVDGKPAPGVAIETRTLDRPVRTFMSGPDGRATIPSGAIGEYGSLIARRGRDVLAWAAYVGLQPDRPAGTEDAPIVMRLLPVDHRVEGSVVDRQGRPVEGVEMTAELLSHETTNGVFMSVNTREPLVDTVLTDRQGRFAMRLPRDTNVSLHAVHPRLIGDRLHVKPDQDRLAPLALRPAGSIAGRVVEAGTGRPVPGAIVGAQYIERIERIIAAWGDARADAQGRFLIGGLEPGVYNLVLVAVPGRPELTARAIEGIRVRLDESTSAELSVMTGRPLRVDVVDRDTGQLQPGMEVGCYGPAHPRSGAAVDMRKTDDQGRVTFRVPPGEQRLYVAAGDNFNNRLASRTVVVPEQGELEPVRLFSQRANTTGMMMGMMKAAGPPPEKAANLPPVAKADVQAANPGRPPAPAEAPEGDGQPAPKAADPNARILTGLVRDPTGRPLPGVEVRISGTENVVATDRDGVFELTEVPAGVVRIDLQRYGGAFQNETVPAGRDRAEFKLAPDTYASPDENVPAVDEPIPADLRDRLTFVDLQRDGNDSLADGPAGGGNDLNRVPRGTHRLGTTYFRIGEKMVHVEGRLRPDLPRAVKGIPVHARADLLHFLHGAQYGGNSDVLIGAYVVHYTDGTTAQASMVLGKNLANWWQFPRRIDQPSAATVAWSGINQAVEPSPGLKIRLFDFPWTNPHPEKEIATLDVLSAGKDCDPFLVALTLERNR